MSLFFTRTFLSRLSSNEYLRYDTIDMLDFQRECPQGIPEDYCYKDYSTGEQSFFQARNEF